MLEIGDEVQVDLSGPCSEKGHVWPVPSGPCLICREPHYENKMTATPPEPTEER